MPRVSQLYFKVGILFLIAGIGVGLHMAIGGDHSAMGAHAHINLLGWVTSALFGVYYALNPDKAATRVAYVQFAIYTLGVLVMTPSLYMLLSGYPGAEPLVAIGSLVVAAGVLLFAVILFLPARSATMPQGMMPAQ